MGHGPHDGRETTEARGDKDAARGAGGEDGGREDGGANEEAGSSMSENCLQG